MEKKSFVRETLEYCQKDAPDEIGFAFFEGKQIREVTRFEFVQDVLKTAAYFRENQLYGKHIALAAPNCYAYVVTWLAIMATGNVAVLLNHDLPVEILQWQCEYSNVDMLCTNREYAPVLQKSLPEQNVVLLEEMQQILPLKLEEVFPAAQEDTAMMMFTSGTTGKSKAVEFSFQNIKSCTEGFAVQWDNTEPQVDGSYLLELPLYHISGVCSPLLITFRKGKVNIGRGFRSFFDDLALFEPKSTMMIPALADTMRKVLRNAKTEEEKRKIVGRNLEVIGICGASPNLDTCRELMSLGFLLRTGYGMTETTCVGTDGLLDETHISSIGKLCSGMECRIQDGEILLKGPSVMKGYYKDPEETAAVIEDGWIHTGDLGYCDEDGYYYITGRKKNVMILSNGENVNPEEIEARLSQCNAIAECLVYSDGKGICADIYTEEKSAVEEFVRTYNGDVPRYHQVYKVNYMDKPLEKTGSGKIKRKENK